MSGLSKEARALIDAASQGDRPRPEDRARLRAMIAAQVAGPPEADPGTASVSGGAAASGGSGGAAVVKIVAVVAIALAGGAALLVPERAPEPPAAEPAPVEASSPVPPSPPPPPAAVLTPPPADLQAARERPDLTHPRARPARHNLEREAQLIGEARVALRDGDPARALGLADAHAARFPEGALRNERLAARALALCALDRRLEARQARAELAARSPRSALLDRVDRACAGVNPSDE